MPIPIRYSTMNLLLVTAVLLECVLAAAATTKNVTIAAGKLQGGFCSGSTASYFLNIPYAKPPVGPLRFASPQPYTGNFSSGVYDARKAGASCIQFGTSWLEKGPTSEDCLYLNIWAPPNATTSSNLPVKVWIHGGNEAADGISNPLYNGCNVAVEGSILVSIDYRLGPLGFLALKGTDIAGNQGIEDILLALNWIQANIGKFGGGTKKVLLFGQGAGATNVFAISALSQAKTLMNSAVLESGGGRDLASSDVAYSLGASYAKNLSCSDAACLRSKSTIELNATNPILPNTIIYSSLHPSIFQPFVDGKIIISQPSANGTKVPSIYGSNKDEGSIFVLGQYLTTNITSGQYTTFLQDNFGSQSDSVAKAYPLKEFTSSPFPAFTAMSTIITDVSYFCPARRALKLAAKNKVSAYTYLFSHTSTCEWWQDLFPFALMPLLNATHTSELAFAFGNTKKLPLPDGKCNFNAAEQKISKNIMAAWTSMAANAKPNANSTMWPLWNATSSMGWRIGNSTTVGVVNYTACDFWDVIEKGLSFSSNATSTSTLTRTSSTVVPTSTAGSLTTITNSALRPTSSTSGASGRINLSSSMMSYVSCLMLMGVLLIQA